MVFETHPGDVFLLGASSWRVIDITHDRVLVVPAAGEPGKMPFWRGEGPGRPLEFGRAIGGLVRRLMRLPREEAAVQLQQDHGLEPQAAQNLLRYLYDQSDATGEVPHDRTLVVECFLDEVGDWRIAILSPFGARVHAPWAIATVARLRERTPGEVDMVWSDDGIVFRLPQSDEPPSWEWLFPSPDEIEDLVVAQLGGTAMFASHFRENAARALLLPRRQPGRRTPLWVQRRRSADLLAVAARYPSFPILLETYRECLRDVFDLPGLKGLLDDVVKRNIRVHSVRTDTASPFAASLLFNYTANFLYDGDAPLAERHAQMLALDHAQLRELLGTAELRELLDGQVVDDYELELQGLGSHRRWQHEDALHDGLLRLGDLTREELALRCEPAAVSDGRLDQWIEQLLSRRRAIVIRVAGEQRFGAAEDAARFRDALGVALAPGLPAAFLDPVPDPLGDLVSRFARTHGPFRADQVAARFGLGASIVRGALERLVARGRILEGEFRPGGSGREYCEADVLRGLKRRSLAKLRKQVEPVSPRSLARFLPHWQGITRPRKGLDGLLDVVEQLQGMPLPASDLERDILPRRLHNYRPTDLDELCAAGEIIWRGFESSGTGDGRIALYLTDHYGRLAVPAAPAESELAGRIRAVLVRARRSVLRAARQAAKRLSQRRAERVMGIGLGGRGHKRHVDPAAGAAPTNGRRERAPPPNRPLSLPPRSSRTGFRRTLVAVGATGTCSGQSHGAVDLHRRSIAATLWDPHAGNGRRGECRRRFRRTLPDSQSDGRSGPHPSRLFRRGPGSRSVRQPGAEDRLREQGRDEDADAEIQVLAATDPANPYGTVIRWPETPAEAARLQRAAGARVILADGELLGYISRLGAKPGDLPAGVRTGTRPTPRLTWRALLRAWLALPKPCFSRGSMRSLRANQDWLTPYAPRGSLPPPAVTCIGERSTTRNMPEGDTLFRIAWRLRPLLEGQSVVQAESPDTRIAADTLVGRRVLSTAFSSIPFPLSATLISISLFIFLVRTVTIGSYPSLDSFCFSDTA